MKGVDRVNAGMRRVRGLNQRAQFRSGSNHMLVDEVTNSWSREASAPRGCGPGRSRCAARGVRDLDERLESRLLPLLTRRTTGPGARTAARISDSIVADT